MLPTAAPRTHDCIESFVELDSRIAAAGLEDAGSHRLSGFPYLRSSRLLASMVESEAPEQWLPRLRARDRHDRAIELINLVGEARASVLNAEMNACAAGQIAMDQQHPDRLERIRSAAQVPDEYAA